MKKKWNEAACNLHAAPVVIHDVEKNTPHKGGKRSQTGGGVWDSHRPSSTTLREREGVGSRRHVCAILPPRRCQELRGTMAYPVVAPCPPSLHILSPPPSFPTIPTSCCFHSVATWRQWPLDGVRSACGRRGDVASSLGVVWGIVEVTWRRWRRWRPVTWRRWRRWRPVTWHRWAASSRVVGGVVGGW